MDFSWSLFLDLGIISLALVIATYLRAKIRFFQQYLIPNALTAGFLLLFFYNFAAPALGHDAVGLGDVVFHLVNLSFIALSLRRTKAKPASKPVFSYVTAILSQYTLQSLLGLGVTFLFIFTILPDLFPGFGFMVPLGYSLGPAKAFAMAKPWEELGFAGAGSVGLTFGAIGFGWATFGGFALIQIGLKRGWVKRSHIEGIDNIDTKRGVLSKDAEKPVGSRLTTESEALDTMTLSLALIFGTYFVTYWFLQGLTWALSFLGDLGMQLATSFWGLTFIFGVLFANLVKTIMKRLGTDHVLDTGTLNRVGGGSIDIMVAAALGAINLSLIAEYWLPILVLNVLAGILVLVVVPFMASRMFDEYQFHNMLVVYGVSTGTTPTGVILLRTIDPNFQTPALGDYVLGTAITFFPAIPLILMFQFPSIGYTTGNPFWYGLTFAILGVYVVVLLIAYIVLAGKKAFAHRSKVWHPED